MQTAILTFIVPVISLIFTFVFLALWWNDRKDKPLLAFAVCFGTLALGVVINIWITQSLSPAGIVAYHCISMAGMLALMWGIAQRAEIRSPVMFFAASVPFVCVVLWLTTYLGLPDAMRLTQNTHSAMITGAIALTLWYGTRRNWADEALVWVLAGLSAFGFIRPVLSIVFNTLMTADGSGPVVLNAIHILVISTLLTLIALCLIASITLGTMQKERELATLDLLTGLANRASFESHVATALEEAARDRIPVSFLVADIDHFKAVNDTWGHNAGDKVITAFGALITNQIRPRDVAGRIGGEEFCVLVWNCSQDEAVSLGNRLRLAFSSSHIAGVGINERFTVSLGAAQWHHGESYAQTFDRADKALYVAKRAGRDRVEAAALPSDANSSPSGGMGADATEIAGDGELSKNAEALAATRSSGDVVSFAKASASQKRGKG